MIITNFHSLNTQKIFNLFIKAVLVSIMINASAAKAEELNCKKSPLYCKILKFKPKIDKTWALKFSNSLHTKAKQANIDENLALAILMQETHLENVNTFTVTKTVQKHCTADKCFKTTTVVEEAFDISIAQINIKTALHYKFDLERLFLFDEDYALQCFFTVLKDKMVVCSYLGVESYSCYHSINQPYRSNYVNLVSRFK